MTLYVDASVWLASVLPEQGSAAALTLLGGDEELAASDWVLTEIASALGIKVRRDALRQRQADQVLTKCRDLLAAHADTVPVDGAACRLATNFAERTSLRAADALHLAIASRAGTVVVTLDRGMAEAGQALGLGTRLLS